jgi:hypothetical protein
MTHQCPKCELKFAIRTVLEDHLDKDHPDFQHNYPASVRNDYSAPGIHVAAHPVSESAVTSEILQTWWSER